MNHYGALEPAECHGILRYIYGKIYEYSLFVCLFGALSGLGELLQKIGSLPTTVALPGTRVQVQWYSGTVVHH